MTDFKGFKPYRAVVFAKKIKTEQDLFLGKLLDVSAELGDYIISMDGSGMKVKGQEWFEGRTQPHFLENDEDFTPKCLDPDCELQYIESNLTSCVCELGEDGRDRAGGLS